MKVTGRYLLNWALQNLRYLTNGFLLLVLLALFFKVKIWNKTDVFAYDQGGYYYYLPAFFHHHDVALNFLKRTEKNYVHYWGEPVRHGIVNRYTAGVAVMEAPFFLIAYLSDGSRQEGSFDEFSVRYEQAVSWAALLYGSLSLLLLYRFLRHYFNDVVTSLVVISVFLGTNLLYYLIYEPGMSHGYSFFLFALFGNLLVYWSQRPNFFAGLVLGICYGLIVLVRPTNLLIGILIPLYGWTQLSGLGASIQRFFFKWKGILGILLGTLSVVSIQIVYWYSVSGELLVYTYADEHFFWTAPKIFDGYFSYRKGLFLYSPVLLFSMAGLLLRRTYQELFWAVVFYLILASYVCFAWWCWWYAGGFGQRALIESFVWMALPMGAFYQWMLAHRNRIVQRISLGVWSGLIVFGLLKTYQYAQRHIHYDGMNRTTYWELFIRKTAPDKSIEKRFTRPDYEKAKLGIDR